jgi:hypothetical protein
MRDVCHYPLNELSGVLMDSHPQLQRFIQGSIRAEKARQNLTFENLSAALRAHGIEQSATNLSTKVGRGGMSAQLYVAIMKVLGKQRIELDEVELPEVGKKTPRKVSKRRR